jgi:hypothetical protein
MACSVEWDAEEGRRGAGAGRLSRLVAMARAHPQHNRARQARTVALCPLRAALTVPSGIGDPPPPVSKPATHSHPVPETLPLRYRIPPHVPLPHRNPPHVPLRYRNPPHDSLRFGSLLLRPPRSDIAPFRPPRVCTFWAWRSHSSFWVRPGHSVSSPLHTTAT